MCTNRMRGVRQSVKKSANSVNLKENFRLAIVADALGQEKRKTFKNTRGPKLILDPY